MRRGCLEDTVVYLYLLFVLSCLYPRPIDLSRSHFCAESVTAKRQSPAAAAHIPFRNNSSGVRGIFTHTCLFYSNQADVRETPAPRKTGNWLNPRHWSAQLCYCTVSMPTSPLSVPASCSQGDVPSSSNGDRCRSKCLKKVMNRTCHSPAGVTVICCPLVMVFSDLMIIMLE